MSLLIHPAFELTRKHSIDSLNLTFEEYHHLATGAQHIHLQADNKENVFRKTVIEENSFYRDDIFDQIIKDINSELLSVWIDITKQSNDKFLYNFVYEINSIDDWVKLRTELETLELLNSFHVTSFNLSKVEGVINFSGNNNKLELIMSQNNIDVANMGPYYKISLYD